MLEGNIKRELGGEVEKKRGEKKKDGNCPERFGTGHWYCTGTHPRICPRAYPRTNPVTSPKFGLFVAAHWPECLPRVHVENLPTRGGCCGIIPLRPGLGGEAEATAREHAARRDAPLQPLGRAREKGVAHWPVTRSRPVVHLWARPVTG